MDELAKRRADKMQDSRGWSAGDCLEDLLNDVRTGKIKPSQLVIHYLEELPEGGSKHHYAVSGVTYPHHIALLSIALNRVISDWKQ